MPSYKKEWMDKAKIDYFSPFVNLWLAFNSWYQNHYSELSSDRDCINKVKSDTSPRNRAFHLFINLLERNDKKGINFRNNIEMLHYSLERANIQPDRIKFCSFRYLLKDYNQKNNIAAYENIIVDRIRSKIKNNGEVRKAYEDDIFRLDSIYIKKDFELFFAGLIEIIYTVRNLTIHGRLEPNKENHEIVKYCYFILWDILEGI